MNNVIHCFPNSFFGNIIRQLNITGFTVKILQATFDMKPYQKTHDKLRNLKAGTVGKEISNLLDTNNLQLIPKFENHDLKHLVLNYKMTLEDEIRMQAYLIGNGNRTFWCMLFFSQVIFMPELWRELPIEYKKGKFAKSIFNLTLDSCATKDLKDLQREYSSTYKTAANSGFAAMLADE